MRNELLNETMFKTMPQARAVIVAWIKEWNEERPHSALGYATPKDFANASNLQSTMALRRLKALRDQRLLKTRQTANQSKGLWSIVDVRSVVGPLLKNTDFKLYKKAHSPILENNSKIGSAFNQIWLL